MHSDKHQSWRRSAADVPRLVVSTTTAFFLFAPRPLSHNLGFGAMGDGH